jgi:hypothetical protein
MNWLPVVLGEALSFRADGPRRLILAVDLLSA